MTARPTAQTSVTPAHLKLTPRMSNTNRPVINSTNPAFLLTICEALRIRFAVQYGIRETEWTAYFVAGDCASVKDEFGGCWDINLPNKQIIPA
jgi:hypothetical protein